MLNVFLDDNRNPIDAYKNTFFPMYKNEEWAIVRNYQNFCSYVKEFFLEKKKLPEIFSFDHNLAPEHDETGFINYDSYKEKTGYHCALWLKNFCDDNNLDYPEVHSHSANIKGAENILSVFYNDNEE